MEKVVVQKSSTQFKEIPIDLIKSPLTPSREVFEDIAVLAETIKQHGLLEPLVVKRLKEKYGFQLVCGERRLKAVKKLKWDTVPCVVLDGINEKEIVQMQIVENIQRSDLKIFEQVRLVSTLRDKFQLSHAEIAAKTGLSPSTVGNYLTIAKGLPQEHIRQIAHESHNPKDLTLTKALILARSNLSRDKLKETVEQIKKSGLTRPQLAKKLAEGERKSKIRRVHQSRAFWNELTRNIRDFHSYWKSDGYTQLREWETVDSFHLELKVSLPKDLGETKV